MRGYVDVICWHLYWSDQIDDMWSRSYLRLGLECPISNLHLHTGSYRKVYPHDLTRGFDVTIVDGACGAHHGISVVVLLARC